MLDVKTVMIWHFFAENSLEYGDSNRLDVWLFFMNVDM